MRRRTVSRPLPESRKQCKQIFAAIASIEGYKESNPAYSLSELQRCFEEMSAAQREELHAKNAYAALRNKAVEKEWAFYDAVMGARVQIAAQFGWDSNEVQAVGYKKNSERKTRGRKKKNEILEKS